MLTYCYHVLTAACWSPSVLEQLEAAQEFLDIKEDFKEECWKFMRDSPKDFCELYRDCVDTVTLLSDLEEVVVKENIAEYQLLGRTIDILAPFFNNWWRDLERISYHCA